jgi:hypothetical protein
MCFGRPWSATSFSILFVSGIFCIYKRVPLPIVAAIYFLAMKELLQFLLYSYAGSCSPMNKFLTTLSWIHISFQPFFMNWFISAFSHTPDMYRVPLVMCLIYAIANMFRIKELNGPVKYTCKPDDDKSVNLCRKQTCSILGDYHVAYGFQLSSSDAYAYSPSFFTYTLLMFAPAFIIGDWQIASIHAAVALITVYLFKDIGEGAAVWCVNSFWIAFFALYYAKFQKSPF